MSDLIENYIDLLLKGLVLSDTNSKTIDFTITDQNAALDAHGVVPNVPVDFKPILDETVTYIVAVILFNESNAVLMTQEAQSSCHGKWYLPTGHMKPNETICSAAAREVLEETGIVVECTTLLMVECASGSWFRFILTGKILGGFLKTVPDLHSLQAQWIQDFQQVSLRSNDCLPLIEHAKKYSSSSSTTTNPKEHWHEEILPCLEPHADLLIRLVTVVKKKSTNRLHVLVSEKIGTHLPIFQVYPTRSLHSTLHKFMIDTFGADMKPHKPHGILTLEHDSNLNGFCISILVSFKAPMEDVPIIGKCFWQQVSKDLGDRLIRRIVHINSNIPLHVIR